jgi:diacylglycerol kinase (ATP)
VQAQDKQDKTKSYKTSPYTPAMASLGIVRVLVATFVIFLVTVALVKFFIPRNIIKGTLLESVAASSTATLTATTTKAKRLGESATHAWIDGTPILQVGINFCSACEEALGPGQGVTCVICGRCSHRYHTTRVEREHACKNVSLPKGGVELNGQILAEHQWAEGNLPLGATCNICKKPVGSTPRLSDFRCLWCRVAVHSHCRSRLAPVCNVGPIPQFVIDPRWVSPVRSRVVSNSPNAKKTRTVRTPRAFRSVQEKYSVSIPPKTATGLQPQPLLAFINPKSGQQDGPMILRFFYSALNPIQVVDLSREKPQDTLDMFVNILGQCRIVVCGGDGTISWILNLLQDMKLEKEPGLAILPLGTGNDLSRVLGWGGGHAGESLDDILFQLKFSTPREMDRWRVTIQSKKAGFWSGSAPKTVFMSNYLSVGCDADIALNFHSTREQNPGLFKSRFLNKV